MCIQLFKNAFLINDLGFGGVCNKCNSDKILVHFKDSKYLDNLNDEDYDYVCWLPSPETHTFKSVSSQSGVCPIHVYEMKSNNVVYRSICCDDKKWKYLKYEKPFGLTYSSEEADCIANMNNVEKSCVEEMTASSLKRLYPKKSMIMIGDTRDNVENQNLEYIYSWVDSLNEIGLDMKYRINFSIDGYGADPRELWDIGEVKLYFEKLLANKPEFIFYLENKLPAILCYVSKMSVNKNNGQVGVAVDREKIVFLSKMALRAIKKIDGITREDIIEYMKSFNASVNQDIYIV